MASMTEVIEKALARTVVMSYHAQVAHWNVMGGQSFLAYHKFFGKIYEQLAIEVDLLAETLRTLREFPADRLSDLLVAAGGERTSSPGDPFKRLADDNDDLLAAIGDAYAAAVNDPAIANTLQDLLTVHEKLAWMLRASMSK